MANQSPARDSFLFLINFSKQFQLTTSQILLQKTSIVREYDGEETLSPRSTTVVPRTKVSGELLCVECGAHEDDLEVGPNGEQVLDDDQQDVRLQVPLVDFVQNQVADGGQQADRGDQASASERVSYIYKYIGHFIFQVFWSFNK